MATPASVADEMQQGMKLRDLKVFGFPGSILNENILVCVKTEKRVYHVVNVTC